MSKVYKFSRLKDLVFYAVRAYMYANVHDQYHLSQDEMDFYVILVCLHRKGHDLSSSNIRKIFEDKKGMTMNEVAQMLTRVGRKHWLDFDGEVYSIPLALDSEVIKVNVSYVQE